MCYVAFVRVCVFVQEEATHQFPMLKAEDLKGAVVYYDGMHNDTRTNVLIALTASQGGAAVSNYVEVSSINTHTHSLVGLQVEPAWLLGVPYFPSHELDARQAWFALQARVLYVCVRVGLLLQVKNLVHDSGGKAAGAVVKDVLTGKEWTIKARGVINATGMYLWC